MTLQKNAAVVKGFAILMQFANWLQNLPNKLTPPAFRVIQIGSAFWQSRVLYSAVCLDIATVLGEEQRSAEAIAAQVQANPDAIYRLLRMLAAMGIFTEVSAQVFKNNKLSNCLRKDNPNNVRAMILMHNSNEMSRPWFEQLEQGIKNADSPFELAFGQEFYTYMDEHSEFDTLFAQAMDCVEVLVGDSFVTDFDWGRFERIIDVGGSKGSKAVKLLQHYPQLQAVVFDRDGVIQQTHAYWQEKLAPEILSRLRFEAGDMLNSVPVAKSAKDIYLLSAVLHGLDDPTCIKLLQNLVTASSGTGAFIAVMELVVADVSADLASAAFDMQMFMATNGRERTLPEWQNLFQQAGLNLEEIVSLQSLAKILVLKQNA